MPSGRGARHRPGSAGTGQKLGASEVYNLAKEDVGQLAPQLKARGFDVVVDTTGSQQGLDLATDIVKSGGLINLFGWIKGDRATFDPTKWHMGGFTVVNSSPSAKIRDPFPPAIDLMHERHHRPAAAGHPCGSAGRLSGADAPNTGRRPIVHQGRDQAGLSCIVQSVLFGTASRAKLDHVRALVQQLPVKVLAPADRGIDLDVEEHGESAEANARIKAAAYCEAARLPAFAIDAGLTIDKFPPGEQPGVYVRRVRRTHAHLSDQALIDHYVAQLNSVGGQSNGRWQVAIALATLDGRLHHRSYAIEACFTAAISSVRIADAPLSSLMFDPNSGTYYSEMAYAERPDSIQLQQTLLDLFQHLPFSTNH